MLLHNLTDNASSVEDHWFDIKTFNRVIDPRQSVAKSRQTAKFPPQITKSTHREDTLTAASVANASCKLQFEIATFPAQIACIQHCIAMHTATVSNQQLAHLLD